MSIASPPHIADARGKKGADYFFAAAIEPGPGPGSNPIVDPAPSTFYSLQPSSWTGDAHVNFAKTPSIRLRPSFFVFAVAVAFVAATTAGAQPQSPDQQKCLRLLARDGANVARAQSKDNLGCLRLVAKGADLPGATAQACLSADPKAGSPRRWRRRPPPSSRSAHPRRTSVSRAPWPSMPRPRRRSRHCDRRSLRPRPRRRGDSLRLRPGGLPLPARRPHGRRILRLRQGEGVREVQRAAKRGRSNDSNESTNR